VQVPLGILSPRIAPGTRADACGSVDVFATLLDLAGVAAPEGRGRNLLGPLPDDGGTAYGMRRTFDEPTSEVRRDGSLVPVVGPRFFAFEAGELYGGDAGAIEREDDGAAPAADARVEALAARFASFAAELERAQAAERGDAATLEALRALGYTR
jgi:hypothetical protein